MEKRIEISAISVFISRAFISAAGNRKHPWAEMMFEILPQPGYEPINEQLAP